MFSRKIWRYFPPNFKIYIVYLSVLELCCSRSDSSTAESGNLCLKAVLCLKAFYSEMSTNTYCQPLLGNSVCAYYGATTAANLNYSSALHFIGLQSQKVFWILDRSSLSLQQFCAVDCWYTAPGTSAESNPIMKPFLCSWITQHCQALQDTF